MIQNKEIRVPVNGFGNKDKRSEDLLKDCLGEISGIDSEKMLFNGEIAFKQEFYSSEFKKHLVDAQIDVYGDAAKAVVGYRAGKESKTYSQKKKKPEYVRLVLYESERKDKTIKETIIEDDRCFLYDCEGEYNLMKEMNKIYDDLCNGKDSQGLSEKEIKMYSAMREVLSKGQNAKKHNK